MKVIAEKFKLIDNLIEINLKANSYIPSKFNVVQPIGEQYIVFNTFTRSILLISSEEYSKLANTSFEQLSDPIIRYYIDNLFLVESTVDETKRYLQVFNFLKQINPISEKIKKVKIYTTTYCNARCFYCFEEGIHKENMSINTAEDVVQYIIKNKYDGEIKVEWFGGEPLCNYKIIDYISKRLAEEKVDFHSSIITNGYLFDDDIISRIVPDWKVNFIEITLDGTREEHNKRKAYVNPASDPYEKTLVNIQKLSQLPIKLLIRLNFDRDNLCSIKELIEILIDKYKDYKNVNIVPVLLFENCFCRNDGFDQMERKDLYKELHQMQDYLTDRGQIDYSPIPPILKKNHCMGDNPSSVVISTDGKLYTCQNCDEAMHYGDIYSGITNPSVIEKWRNPKSVRSKCLDCAFLPECTPFDSCPVEQDFCKTTVSYLINKKLSALVKKQQS